MITIDLSNIVMSLALGGSFTLVRYEAENGYTRLSMTTKFETGTISISKDLDSESITSNTIARSSTDVTVVLKHLRAIARTAHKHIRFTVVSPIDRSNSDHDSLYSMIVVEYPGMCIRLNDMYHLEHARNMCNYASIG